jgi:predicted TIM-barrel fold metal-dependent hydrolase
MSQGRVVISMDSHTELVVDLKPWLPAKYHEAFDAGVELQERYSSASMEAFGWQLEEADVVVDFPTSGERKVELDEYKRRFTPEERVAAIDADGVAAEFIVAFTGTQTRDPELLHECSVAYDRYFSDYVASHRDRFKGSGVANLICGIDTLVAEVEHAYDHGLSAVELSGCMDWVSRDAPALNSPYYDPMWGALNERGMGVIFHGGPGWAKPLLEWEPGDPGWEPLLMFDYIHRNREGLNCVLMAGVPERFPNLKIGYIESGSRWIPPVLQELDIYAQSLRRVDRYMCELLPSEQWREFCFVGGTLDAPSVAERDDLGVKTLMWGSDFPHVESSWPHTTEHLASIFAGVPDAEITAMTSANAARCFGFDLDQLAQTPAARVPWPEPKVSAAV